MKKGIFKCIAILVIVVGVLTLSVEDKIIGHSGSQLEKVVIKALAGAKGKYSVLVKNLKTGEEYLFYSHKEYKTGSLYKLWVMATVFNQIQKGLLGEDEVLSEDIAVLNSNFNIDPNLAELKDGSITLTVREALKQMITISHNYAALLLAEKVGLSKVAAFINENQFKESAVGVTGGSPHSTAYDIALFFEKLYKGQLADPNYTNQMLDLLKMQKLNSKLPKYLPSQIPVAHKTGEIDFLSHDAGIVYTEKGDYIIVVFSESDYPPGAEDRIAKISRAVYDYFLSKP